MREAHITRREKSFYLFMIFIEKSATVNLDTAFLKAEGG